jgi:DNA-binding transcriptional LysR family regulator
MMIDLVQLQTFVAVAEEGHLTRTAERLHISQSAASAHVRAVEELLDLQLFVRANRSLELTRAGQVLLPKAKALLNEAAHFRAFAREMHGKIEGELVIGSTSEAGSRVGDMVAALCKLHPLVTVNIIARPSQNTRLSIKSGEVDVGVLLGRATDPEFTYYQLTAIDFVVAGPAAWRATLESASWEHLACMPWLTPNNSSAYSAMLAQLFGEKGLELNTVVHWDNASLGRSILKGGWGVMLVREDEVADAVREGSVALAPIARTQFPLCIAHQSSRSGDPLIEAFVDVARTVWPQMALVTSQST